MWKKCYKDDYTNANFFRMAGLQSGQYADQPVEEAPPEAKWKNNLVFTNQSNADVQVGRLDPPSYGYTSRGLEEDTGRTQQTPSESSAGITSEFDAGKPPDENRAAFSIMSRKGILYELLH